MDMQRFDVIKDRFYCDKPIDSRDIGWLIDEITWLTEEATAQRHITHCGGCFDCRNLLHPTFQRDTLVT